MLHQTGMRVFADRDHIVIWAWSHCQRRSKRRMPFESSTYTAESLPLAVWAEVFSYLKPDCENVTSRTLRSISKETRQSAVTAVAASQSQYLHLKLVCRTFNQVFKMEQCLSDQPMLVQADPARLMPSFQIWLKQYSGSVK